MSNAIIIFIDIVKFSKKSPLNQTRLADRLRDEVHNIMKVEMLPLGCIPSVTALPTGDGMALVFEYNAQTLARIFKVTLDLVQTVLSLNAGPDPLTTRIGVHAGGIHQITDINGRANVTGNAINGAQRVMDAADPGTALASVEFLHEVLDKPTGGDGTPYSYETDAANWTFAGSYEVPAKHGEWYEVYVMHPQLKTQQGTQTQLPPAPQSRDILSVSLSKAPKQSDHIHERLARSQDVALIMLDGANLLPDLVGQKIALRADLKRFLVFMPRPALLGYRASLASEFQRIKQLDQTALTKAVDDWKSYLLSLRAAYPSALIKLGLYDLPLMGASCFDWQGPNGFIHVSPYVWGMGSGYAPGFDIVWTSKRPELASRYVEGLNWLMENAEEQLNQAVPAPPKQ